MPVTIAIHRRPGSFSDQWIDYCARHGIDARPVDGYSTTIMRDLRGCDAFMWHVSHDSATDLLFARSVLGAAALTGLTVYPNHHTVSHFDDKVAQKYLLESVDAPLAPTWVFFSRREALAWVSTARFPLVFKLRRGAGSSKVSLVTSAGEAARLVDRMFGGGLSPVPRLTARVEQIRKRRRTARDWRRKAKDVPRLVSQLLGQRMRTPHERGYVLFQEFIPNNDHDIRVTVIGSRAFVFRRRVRPGDFRASGSGLIEYFPPGEGDPEAVHTAFSLSQRLGFQSMAFDFVTDHTTGRRLIVEISYSFNAEAVHACPGFFDPRLTWRDGHFWPQDLVIEDVASTVTLSA
jgi:glutathione synthase/RimK-type ligase-like ATP-grasp enzyme